MKKLLLLAIVAILFTVSARAQQADVNTVDSSDPCLVIWQKNGTYVMCHLNKNPKITFDSESVKVESTETATYDFKSIRRITFAPEKKKKGDVNGDRFVNMADVYQVVSFILAGSNDKSGDVNEDGVVNVADIVAIRSIVNEKSTEVTDVISLTRAAEDDVFYEGSHQLTVEIILNSGEMIDYDTSEIGSINFTTKELTISFNGTSRTILIEDINSILFMSPTLTLMTKSLDFGKVEVDYAKTLPVTLTNTGDYPETYTILTDGVFAVKTPYQEMTVMAGQSVSIDLTFVPKEVKSYNSYLTISSNSAENGMLRLPVKGEGVATAAEEEDPYIEPVEQEIAIVLAEGETPESLEGYKVSNIYGDFPVQINALTRDLSRTRQGNNNQYACTANVPVSSNGLQFHSLIDEWGNPWMFSISLPLEKPEISFKETAIALLMSTPDLMTKTNAEYRNVVKLIESLKTFPDFVDQVRKIYNAGKKNNMCPDYSNINMSPIFNELYGMTKDTRDLRLSGVSLKDINTTPQIAKFKLRNDFKRCIHAYPSRVRMNEANEVIVSQEDAAPTIKEKLQMLLDEGFDVAGDQVNDQLTVLDSEDKEFIDDLLDWLQEIGEEKIFDNTKLESVFQLRLPYALESKGIDYIDALGDGLDAYVFGIGKETSIFEVESGTIEVSFKEYDKIFVDIYGVGLLGDKSWSSFTKKEKLRIVLALVWGAYKDYIEPAWKGITGVKEASDAWNLNYKFDLRYGKRKYPEWALLTKLFHAFISKTDNWKKLEENIQKEDIWGIAKQLAKFSWDQLKSIPKESDNIEDKRTYTNLIYNIYKKWSGNSATSETFRKTFKAGANQFLGKVNFIYKWMSVSEKGVDLIGAYKALKESNLKDTHIIDMYNHPNITMKSPLEVYQTHDVNVKFEWDTYKSNTIGEYLYDLELMTETPSGVTQTVVLPDIKGNSCEYNLNNLSGAKNAMKIYYRIVAHNPAYSQVFVPTEFIPLVLMDKAKAPKMVDLGLPSGTLWAECNLGAETNENYGNYYAWGETATKTSFSWKNYKYCKNGQQNALTKYNTKSNYGKVDNKTQIDAADDCMTANYGYFYAIPTKEDWDELNEYCKWSYDARGGYMVRGGNGELIFLPFAGYQSGLNQYDVGKDGYYWSSTLDKNSPDDAWFMHISQGKHELNSFYRSQGRNIRPVMHKIKYREPKEVRFGTK